MNFQKLSKTPFLKKENNKIPVYLSSNKGAYKNTLAALKNIDLSITNGKKVLLKPNIGRMSPAYSGVNTHPEVIAAAIDAFKEAGAEVFVGESPITGVKTFEAFEKSGVTEIAENRNCPLIDMDEKPFVEVKLPEGKVIDKIKMCRDILDYDYIVSIPVIKMHMHTVATLSVKNMKGCLWRRSKVKLHMLPPIEGSELKPLDMAIADMAWALTPHLAIIDGTICLEGLGPSAGTPKEVDTVIVSADAFAADAVACKIMGMTPEEVPHLKIAADRGYGTIDFDKITVSPSDWEKFIKPFEKPPLDISVQFDNVKILDENSCSACQSTLLLFLKKYGDRLLDYFDDKENVYIAIGKGHKDVPEGTLCVGNCTIKHKDKGIFVKGCPPVGSEILKAIANITHFEGEEQT